MGKSFWLKCTLLFVFGILGSNSGTDPFSKQPRLVVEDGHLTIKSGYNRNVSISTDGQGGVFVNKVDMLAAAGGRSMQSATVSALNRRVANLLDQWQSVSDLVAQVNQLEENVTDISQRLTQFVGTDQNRVTNRGMRRYFAKVKILEEKVNRLTELLSTNECASNPCRNGGTCVDSYNGYVCNCPSNWEGPTCESDVNECAFYAGTGFGCQNGATCTNLPGSYRCDCPTNWFGIHCTEQHDDCSAASHQELCGHGTCVNEKRVQPGQPKYRCICEPGWKTAGSSPACTEDVDECAGPEPKCSVNPRVQCLNLPGTFFCGPCPAGYTGNGLWCEDVNECEYNNGGCSINPFVECRNIPGSRRCGPCPNGYFGNGEQCMFQSACSNNNGGCHPLATCIDNPAITMTHRECRCPSGYVGNGVGLTGCTQTQGITCANNPCQHGTCQMAGNSYHCVCEAGYYGANCEQAENVCSRNPCLNGGTCYSSSGTFTCTCPSGYRGPTCAEQERACGGYLTQNNGTLHYPQYSTHYDHEESCAWVISVEEGKVVSITFDHFHLEGGYNCEFDFLQLNDGPNAGSRVIGRFCSDQLHGDTFNSTHNQVYLWFRSDRSISATGFTINWKAADPVCGGILNGSDYGSVRSPGYPGLYPLNRTCSWLVQVPYGKRIQFSFATLMLEHHENCSFDYLKIFDGESESDPLIGTYCTTTTPPPLITSGHAATLVFHSDSSVQDTGFNIAYSAMPGIEGCGGTVTGPQGIIKSPDFPASYSDNRQCEWLVRIHPDNRIQITFVEFTIEGGRDCVYESLEIFDGPTDASNLLGRFCGGTTPPDILSNTHQVYIRFKTGSFSFQSGFKVEYKTICGGVYTDTTGVLTSPFYPDPYGDHTSCLYEISLPEGYLVNLTLHNIEIEHHPECRFDSLEIRDGESNTSPLLAMICGYLQPRAFISSFNKMWLKFQTDGSVQNRGFYAEYEGIDMGCGGIRTENNSEIFSPRHPEMYPHNANCTWLIKAPEGHIIRLTFPTFNLERSSDCQFDYVLLEDTEGIRVGKFCGDVAPPVLTTMDNAVLVKFHADESVARDGFHLRYEFLNANDSCGGDIYQASGVIKSPGYPYHYPHSAKCVWVLHAPNSKQITLNVTDFNTEFHSDCKYDYLEIRNGGYKTSPLIGRYCGNQIMPMIQSHSNLMWMEFKSDGSMSAPGFQIQFDTSVIGCGGTLTASRGSIVSPNYPQPYPQSADCEWLIRVSEGSKISVSIVAIDIEEHHQCQFDYLQIFDGATENDKSLVRICNNQQNPGPIMSKGNSVLIRFRSDFSEEAGGFHLVYETLCSNVLTKRRGVIESPNFPNPYPHNHNCTWTIQAPLGSNISISFSHLFIEGEENCTMDYVEVREVPEPPKTSVSLGKFCGTMTRPPPTITTTTNTAVVQLITDRSVSEEGFRLEYTFIGCGGDIIDKYYGFISSPNYPNSYPIKTVCYWHIRYPPGNSVELTIQDLDLESIEDCQFDFLSVYGGENSEAPRIYHGCHASNNGTVITSHGNQMFVHFSSDYTISHRGFRAIFKKLETGCGGRFTTDEATILTPNFPEPYTINDACEWLIETSSNNLVTLQFYDFELPDSVNCTSGHVAIYDGSNTSAPLLLRHCGTTKPEGVISSTGSQMLVTLVADGNNIAKGFRAHYKRGCGRRLLADEGGEITSLYYPNTVHVTINCSWILYTSQIGEKVILTVTHLNVPASDNCSFSSLMVYDGDMEDSPIIGQYCGHHLPLPVISRSSTLHVFSKRLGTFRATYGLLSQHCGGVFTSASGTFSSPGYPTNYDMEMECVWEIEASAGSKVHVTFQSFHLEDSDYCNTDYVEIHENDPTGRLIGKYCGNSIPSNVTSAHKLWIKFRSDDIGTAPGFLAHFEMEHGLTITGTSGDIASPGYPLKFHRDDVYQWTIIVPDGMFVSVQVTELSFPVGEVSNRACYAKLKIIDGFDEESPVLGEYCGYMAPEPVFSTGNVLKVSYEPRFHFGSRFYLHWSAVNASGMSLSGGYSCLEEHIINGTELVTIQSPNYPSNYPNEYNCTYMIRTSPTHHIDLRFEAFQFEGSPPQCAYDNLQSYIAPNPSVDSWTLNATLCDTVNNAHLTSPNNVLKLQMNTDRWLSQPGFKATAKADCGGQLFGRSGVLHSYSIYPNMQNVSGSDTFQCEWVITVKERRTIQLTFENFDVESDNTCNSNYILIRNGGFSTSPVLGSGRYCGGSPPTLPETSSNQAFVQLVYKPAAGRSPVFDLRYSVVTVGCGGNLYLNSDIPSVEVASPNYPSPPTHDAECDWIIVSPSGTRLRVDFESEFNFGDCWGEEPDYLELYDGGTENAPVLRRYCGQDQPSSVMSTGNALFMKFVSGSDDKQSGFKSTVRIASCGGTISSMFSLIQSPYYPGNYGSSMECEWFLKMPYGYHMSLNISAFETPTSSNCSLTDYLEIRNMDAQGELLGRYCGRPKVPIFINVPGNEVYVKFKSNTVQTAKGFSMFMSANIEEGCGGLLQDPSGVITSPRYPNALTYYRQCNWHIYAPAGRKIKVHFEEMNLPYDENSNTCSSFVALFNITFRYWARRVDYTHKFCGTTLPDDIDSSSSSMIILLNTHGLAAGQGFKLSYTTEEEAICGGVLPAPPGVFTSPNFPVQNGTYLDCKWNIQTQENQTIVFKFEYLDLPGVLANYCRESVLYFILGSRYGSSYCGNYTNGLMITSPFSFNMFRMLTSIEKPIRGFNATYSVSDCGGVLDGSNAVVTSPGYPNNYPPDVHCNWHLQVPYGEIMQITVVDLRLEEDCTKDYVLIRNSRYGNSRPMGKFCGSHSVAPIISSTATVIIEFHSDAFGTAPGFKISTTEVQRGCGGLIHKQLGNLSSPNYPSRYSNNVECVWTIEYNPGYLVKVEFTGRFDIEMDASCSKDYVQLDEMDDSNRWVSQSKKCGSVTPQPFVSKSNKLRILFHSNDRIVGDGFNLRYKAECGGNFTRPSGDVFSPNYPGFYTDNLNCTYVIGKPGEYISLTFDDYFSLEVHDTCVYDYVEIYSRWVNESSKQGGYCGTEAPAPRTLMAPVTVRFVTDYGYVAHGFKLHYQVHECGAVLTTPSGVISSPNITGNHLNFFSCIWHITAPPDKVIQLRFLYFHLPVSYGCYSEYLMVYDGDYDSAPIVGRFCGEGSRTVKSTGNTLALRFYTGPPSSEKGFALHYDFTFGPKDGCGGSLNSSSGQISSLDANSDGFYEPFLDCGWMIYTTAPDLSIKLEFNAFDLQMPTNGSCDADFLEIREFDTEGLLLGRYCGNTLPPAMMVGINRLFVHFHSDGSGSNSGFRITYSIVPSPCGTSDLIAEREPKTLTSPNYPSPYPVNLRCLWRVLRNNSNYYRSPTEVTVTDMDIPCGGGDFLQIKRTRIRSQIPQEVTKDCGSNPPQVIKMRYPVITFNSDSLNNGGRGFSLTYRLANCNSTYTTDSGVIISEPYPSRVNFAYACRINITVSAGKKVSLYFKDLSFFFDQQCQNYVKFYDGSDDSAPLLASYCGVVVPNPVFATGNSLFVNVVFPNRLALYHMTYMASEKASGCGGSIFASEGALTSPLYPRPYNKTGECAWHISVPGYHTIVLNINAFELNSTAGCSVNFLEIYEGSTVDVSNRVSRYCGQDLPSRHELRTNNALVRLVTDATNDKSGFSMIFTSSSYLPAINPSHLVQRFPTNENH